MAEDLKVYKECGVTIYHTNSNEKFRIKQVNDNEFIIEKLIKKKESKGCLWWKQVFEKYYWKRSTIDGREFTVKRYLSEYHLLKTYKSLEEAKSWINNYKKYPIYH